MINDKTSISGTVTAVLRDSSGNIKKEYVFPNLVVTTGLNYIANKMAGNVVTTMSHMAIGSSNTAASAGQTALVSELARVALTSTIVSSNLITYNAFYGAGVGTGTVNEAGVFNDPTTGIMLNRAVFPAPIPKNAGDTLTVAWQITLS